MIHDIIIGGIRVGHDAAHGLSQNYETIGGSVLRRALSGRGIPQVHWEKIKTVISGVGRLPAGLSNVPRNVAIQLDCAAPLSIWDASNVATLPTARRTDWAPFGYAIVAGEMVETPLGLAGDVATLTVVSGAQGYVFVYYPVLQVIVGQPYLEFDLRGVELRWTITAEEV